MSPNLTFSSPWLGSSSSTSFHRPWFRYVDSRLAILVSCLDAPPPPPPNLSRWLEPPTPPPPSPTLIPVCGCEVGHTRQRGCIHMIIEAFKFCLSDQYRAKGFQNKKCSQLHRCEAINVNYSTIQKVLSDLVYYINIFKFKSLLSVEMYLMSCSSRHLAWASCLCQSFLSCTRCLRKV